MGFRREKGLLASEGSSSGGEGRPLPGPKHWAPKSSRLSLPLVPAKSIPHCFNVQMPIFLLHRDAPAVGSVPPPGSFRSLLLTRECVIQVARA